MALINWGEFDGDLLNLILSKLFGKNRLSFGLVCRHWNEVAKTAPTFSPCLVYYNRRTHAWELNQHNAFFSTRFPDLEGAEVLCSKHGWLLMFRYDDDTFFFFDPSNNQKVELPPVFDVELRTVFCFFHPPTSPECVVVGIGTDVHRRVVDVCTLTRGEGEWKSSVYLIDDTGDRFFRLSPGPPVLHRGLIYFLSVNGYVATLDIKKQRLGDVHFDRPIDELLEKNPKAQFLVKVKGQEEDEMFGVFVIGDDSKVKVFRLSSTSGMKWELMEEGIGDKVLYVSYTSCFGYKAPTKCMENTICFPLFRGEVPVFYSLGDAEYRSIDGEYSAGNAHGLKSLDFATWVLPTPTWEVDTNFVWGS